MEIAVRALIATVFAAVVCIVGMSMATAAVATPHLAHTVTHPVADALHPHVVPISQH